MQTTLPTRTESLAANIPPAATRWLKLAVIYLLLGISMGIVMGATENFTLRPVHAHVGLLGWASLGLAGLIYSVFPTAATSRLGRIHFWLHNLGLPLMMAALAALLLGVSSAIPFLVTAELMLASGFVAFALNVFRNLDR